MWAAAAAPQGLGTWRGLCLLTAVAAIANVMPSFFCRAVPLRWVQGRTMTIAQYFKEQYNIT